jgi:hypothetical protein
VTDLPYVLLSCAVSVDGYIDDGSDARLLLSNDEDFDRVDEVRSGVDAVLVGAGTIRVRAMLQPTIPGCRSGRLSGAGPGATRVSRRAR